MAQNIPDASLYAYAEKVKDQVVLITGGAAGLGRGVGLTLASKGAKIVLGDTNLEGAKEVAAEIHAAGGDAVAFQVDVADWKQMCNYFIFAMKVYGRVDVVYANAGVGEVGGPFMGTPLKENNRPQEPDPTTVGVNLKGVVIATRLAIHFFKASPHKDSLKSVVINGSMSSLNGVYGLPVYGSTKHALLAFASSIRQDCELLGIQVTTVAPWFTETALVPMKYRILLAGVPWATYDRVIGALCVAATLTGPTTNGGVYAIPDDGPVFFIPHTQLTEDVYTVLDSRAQRRMGIKQKIAIASDLADAAYRGGVLHSLLYCTTIGLAGFMAWRKYGNVLLDTLT